MTQPRAIYPSGAFGLYILNGVTTLNTEKSNTSSKPSAGATTFERGSFTTGNFDPSNSVRSRPSISPK